MQTCIITLMMLRFKMVTYFPDTLISIKNYAPNNDVFTNNTIISVILFIKKIS